MSPSLPTEPLASLHNSLTTLAERALRDMILDGRLVPGARMNEGALADALHISRGPLRQAIERLEGQGLVSRKSHRGATVKVFEWSELIHLYELRTALECFAVGSLAKGAQHLELAKLSALLVETANLLSSEPEPYPSDLDFHRFILGSTANPVLIEVHEATLQKIELARHHSANNPVRALAALSEHRMILSALLRGDAVEAAALMAAHLNHSLVSAGSIIGRERLLDDGGNAALAERTTAGVPGC